MAEPALRRRAGECGNTYLDEDAVATHLSACTEAGITAGFHVIGDAAVGAVVSALAGVVARFGAPRWPAAVTASSIWRW